MKLATAFLAFAILGTLGFVVVQSERQDQLAAWAAPAAAPESPARAALDAAVPGAGAKWETFPQTTRDIAARAAIAAREAPAEATPPATPPVTPEVERELILCSGHGYELNDPFHDVLIENKHFKAAPGSEGLHDGLRVIAAGTNLTVRNCVFEGFRVGLNIFPIEGRHVSGVRIEQCIVIDSFGGQGIYAQGVDDLRIVQTVFDQCGWHPGAQDERTNFDHCAYIDNGNTRVVVSECWFANPASYGMQLRCGGVVSDCLILRAANGLRLGGGGNAFPLEIGGVLVDVRNVAILGRAAPPKVSLEGMLTLSNIGIGVVERLLIAGPAEGDWKGWSVLVAGDRDGVGIRGTALAVDTAGWTGDPMRIDGPSAAIEGSSFVERMHLLPVDLSHYDALLLHARQRTEPWNESYSPRAAIAAAWAEVGTN